MSKDDGVCGYRYRGAGETRNEESAGKLNVTLIDIYKAHLADMKKGGDLNVSLLREVREFLKMHSIELDPNSAPLQELKSDHDELNDYRKRRKGTA